MHPWRPWTTSELRRLDAAWGETTLAALASELERPAGAVYKRAWQRGLVRAQRQGRLSLRAAARVAGYHPEALRAMLGAARLEKAATASPAPGAHRWHAIDADDVRRVVEERGESISAAARRLGVTYSWLWQRVHAAGVPVGRARVPVRRPSEFYDGLVPAGRDHD